MHSSLSKPALRQQLRAARDAAVRAMTADERARQEQMAAARLLEILKPGVWASYIAMGTEISPAALIPLTSPEQTVVYPWFASRDEPMIFRKGSATDFTRGPFGIRQPDSASAELMPDHIILPLVGVDACGNRIGQGAGHYDRALEKMRLAGKRPLTIGLAWDVQLVDTVPADPWDEPLDYIVTPSRVIRTDK